MRGLRRGLVVALLLCGLAGAQPAPEPTPPALAHATGRASVSQPASLMSIAVERTFEGETFAVIWPQALTFRSDLIAALNELGGHASLRMTIAIESTVPARLMARGHVLLNFGPILGQADGEAALAKALDEAVAVCVAVAGTPGEVSYELTDEAALRQQAIRAATEDAFLPAEAIAQALRSDLYNVDQVRIKSVEISSGAPKGSRSESANAREVTCTAEVEVTYVLADRP